MKLKTVLTVLALNLTPVFATTHQVSILPGRFEPQVLNIQAGDSVEFVNETESTHTVTANPQLAKNPANMILPAGAKPFHSGRLTLGGKFIQEFTVQGLYQYVCLPHEAHGMKAQIIVAK